MEVFGGCNYTCQMCPQSNPGRGKSWTRKMPLKEFERILDEIVQIQDQLTGFVIEFHDIDLHQKKAP